MARITVEDCVTIVPNRFELCLIAGNRAKSILSGSGTAIVNNKKEKPAVVALREIAENSLNVDAIRQNIIATIKSKNNISSAIVNNVSPVEEMMVEEMQTQNLKDTVFVNENIQVED